MKQYSFGLLWGDNDQYCVFLCVKLQLNFKKISAGPGGIRRFNGQSQVGLEVGALSLFFKMFGTFRGGDSVTSTLCLSRINGFKFLAQLVPFLSYFLVNLFLQNVYAKRLFGRCSRFLDPALNTSQ